MGVQPARMEEGSGRGGGGYSRPSSSQPSSVEGSPSVEEELPSSGQGVDSQEKGDSAGTWSEDHIPVIDLDILVNGNAAQRSRAIRDLGQACEEWGFFMIASNGRYKAALHRAMVHGEKTRMSSVSMIGPCLDTVVQPIPELALQGVEFRGIKYSEYIEHQRAKKPHENAASVIARGQREILARQAPQTAPRLTA
ncbi:hypothetical protein ACQ4PT_042437 [Festuca glaucescens]